jgi:hypothetical protein
LMAALVITVIRAERIMGLFPSGGERRELYGRPRAEANARLRPGSV